MLRYLYAALFTLALPWVFLRLWHKGNKNPAYHKNWAERLGRVSFRLEKCIWLHGVSLGEMVAAAPLIQTLLNQQETLFLTCMTPTGRQEAQKWARQFPNQVSLSYLPYDIPWILRRVIKRTKPKLLIVMETELWPNLFHEVKVPIIIANARISDRALPKYLRIRNLMRTVLQPITAIATQSEGDAERFKQLGAAHVSVMGNIKYDLADPLDVQNQALSLQKSWTPRLILTAGSTHDGEEAALLKAYQALKPDFPDLLLILAPRHPERFDQVEALCLQNHLTCLRRSTQKNIHHEDILLIDTLGELKTFYALADLVFVGGSLTNIGGHNILEAAILGKPIIVGPYMQNARQVVKEFLAHKALIQIDSDLCLSTTLKKLLSEPEWRKQLGTQAEALLQKNRGATDRLMRIISLELSR